MIFSDKKKAPTGADFMHLISLLKLLEEAG
ncbi:hypothetical protein STPE111643_06290 [Streptococcus penaeicida]